MRTDVNEESDQGNRQDEVKLTLEETTFNFVMPAVAGTDFADVDAENDAVLPVNDDKGDDDDSSNDDGEDQDDPDQAEDFFCPKMRMTIASAT